jgi:hypothetical protein
MKTVIPDFASGDALGSNRPSRIGGKDRGAAADRDHHPGIPACPQRVCHSGT